MTASERADVTVVGSITRDIVPGPPALVHWGGVPTYAGITLSRLGLRVQAVANLAAADQPQVRRLLEAEGVLCRLGTSETTTTFRFEDTSALSADVADVADVGALSDGRDAPTPAAAPADDRRQTLVSAAAPILASDLDAAFDVTAPAVDGVVVLGPVHELDVDAALLDRCFRSGSTVAIDLQGLLRPTAVGPVVERVTATIERLAIQARFLKLSAHEVEIVAAHFGPAVGPRELLRRWRVDELVVTMGARGGAVYAGARRESYSAVPVKDSVRPIGAGDVMFAAYIAARVFDRLPIDAAARAAAEVAGRQVAGAHIRPTTLAAGESTAGA